MLVSTRQKSAPIIGLALAASALLGGCATYRPAPLAVDAGIERATLAEALALPAVVHPRLAAAELKLDQPLGELDVARLALLLNPDLRAQRRQIGVADAQLFAAGLLPSATIGAGAAVISAVAPSATVVVCVGNIWQPLSASAKARDNRWREVIGCARLNRKVRHCRLGR